MCLSVPLGTYGVLTTVAGAASPPHTLPVGAATSYLFGYTKSEGSKISLLPPNDSDVNQSLVARASRLGPSHIRLSAQFCGLAQRLQPRRPRPTEGARAVHNRAGRRARGQQGREPGIGRQHPPRHELQVRPEDQVRPPGSRTNPELGRNQPGRDRRGRPRPATSSLWPSKRRWRTKYPAQYADYPALKNGVKCFDNGNELQCLKGDAIFWVSGRKVTGGNLSGVDQSVWVDQVEIPLAEVIGAELTTSA